MNRRKLVSCAIVLGIATMLTAKADDKSAPEALNFKVKSLTGKEVDLAQYEGKVVVTFDPQRIPVSDLTRTIVNHHVVADLSVEEADLEGIIRQIYGGTRSQAS